MVYEDTLPRIINILEEHLGVEEQNIYLNSDFVDDLGADSLDTIELAMAFEEEFQIEIDDRDAENFHTVEDAITFIENVRKVQGK